MANTEHPISGLMDVTLDKIRQMVDSNTIIGNPINTADGSTILPVSRVSFGFASGGSDFVSSKAPKDLFGGGSGAGVSIQPVAFLVLKGDNVRMIQLADKSSTMDRALNMLPEVMDKLQSLTGGKKTNPDAPPKDKKFGGRWRKTAAPPSDDAPLAEVDAYVSLADYGAAPAAGEPAEGQPPAGGPPAE